jgi:hypothetical protein
MRPCRPLLIAPALSAIEKGRWRHRVGRVNHLGFIVDNVQKATSLALAPERQLPASTSVEANDVRTAGRPDQHTLMIKHTLMLAF